jgi:mannose-6-phosphate isomerase
MNVPPLPVVFEPLFKPKPWGGQRLATLLNKRLPTGERIGESWELVSLPGNESRVRGGPLAGQMLSELVQRWGHDLLGDAQLAGGRFPLLIKFLDAGEYLSVQVHPKPDGRGGPPSLKHETWYVIHAEPGAKLFIGLKPGVEPAEVARVANTPAMVDVLRAWDAQPGQCYYLPSGTLHALGAGVVVAEVQTPSDVTYRAYDWGRADAAGRPRELHIAQALANVRYDVTEEMIAPPPTQSAASPLAATRVVRGERFALDVLSLRGGCACPLTAGVMRVWIILAGTVRFTHHGRQPPLTSTFARGDVVLIPAACADLYSEPATDCNCIEVTIPRDPRDPQPRS